MLRHISKQSEDLPSLFGYWHSLAHGPYMTRRYVIKWISAWTVQRRSWWILVTESCSRGWKWIPLLTQQFLSFTESFLSFPECSSLFPFLLRRLLRLLQPLDELLKLLGEKHASEQRCEKSSTLKWLMPGNLPCYKHSKKGWIISPVVYIELSSLHSVGMLHQLDAVHTQMFHFCWAGS